MKRFLITILILLCSVPLVFASDTAQDLSKEANSLIRQAENKFFSSKIEDSDAFLKQAEKILEKLKTIDTGHKSLKTLQGKHDRLRKRVDQKLNTNAKAKSPRTEVNKSVETSGIKTLSHGAKSNLKKANKEMDFAEEELAKGEKSLAAGDYNMVKSYIFNLERRIGGAQRLLEKVVNNNKADPDHADVSKAFQRLKLLQAKDIEFKQQTENQEEQFASVKETAKADAEALNKEWLPKIKPYIDYSGSKRIQFTGMHNKSELAKQDQYFTEAKSLLVDCKNQTSNLDVPHELSKAIKDLQFKIEVYEQERNAGSKNLAEPVKNTLNEWARRFEQNKSWDPASSKYLYIVSPQKIAYQKEQIKGIKAVMPDQAKELSVQLTKLEKENGVWQKKKTEWANRPQPFPDAGMKSQKLEKELAGLLKDREIKFDKLHIVDKDWWVLKGEYRYMKGAFFSKDSKGFFWSSFNFRQIQTLSGYGPTELWEISGQKIRLP